jgi:hypothetical protein
MVDGLSSRSTNEARLRIPPLGGIGIGGLLQVRKKKPFSTSRFTALADPYFNAPEFDGG